MSGSVLHKNYNPPFLILELLSFNFYTWNIGLL